jgi:hypothetical protein
MRKVRMLAKIQSSTDTDVATLRIGSLTVESNQVFFRSQLLESVWDYNHSG